jgi:hypothetical protein
MNVPLVQGSISACTLCLYAINFARLVLSYVNVRETDFQPLVLGVTATQPTVPVRVNITSIPV